MGHSASANKVKVAFADIDGVLRGKYLHASKFNAAKSKGLSFCNVVLGWDMHDNCYPDAKYTGWHSGYPDATARIDLKTLRTIPWESNIPFYLLDFSNDPEASKICARSLLQNIEKEALDLDFKAVFAQEFEWFNFFKSTDNNADLESITAGMFGYSITRTSENSQLFHALFDQLEAFGIPLEGLHTETGPGVFEAAIQHTTLLEAADRAVLFKNSVKELSIQDGIVASFMAKWNEKLPGCGGHIHQSLWDLDQKKNHFFGKGELTETLKQYIAGQLYCLPYILPMFAPTINSYKRLVEGTWAPINATWGIENRTCALRVIPELEDSMRLEMRVPGADVNPYLAMAASLASGLYGIKNKLKLTEVQTIGSSYENPTAVKFPKTLKEATQCMKESEVATALFGETFVDHFCMSRFYENLQFEKSVTNWELNRYFEII